MADETHDFDAWRAAQRAARQPVMVRIFGQDVPAPTEISLDLSMRIHDTDMDDAATVTALVGELFGEGELARWREAGCTAREFAVLLAWGSARASGEDVTFGEVAKLVAEQAALGKADPQPAGNRAQRRAAKRPAPRR